MDAQCFRRYSRMVIHGEKLWVARRGSGALIDREELKKWGCCEYTRVGVINLEQFRSVLVPSIQISGLPPSPEFFH